MPLLKFVMLLLVLCVGSLAEAQSIPQSKAKAREKYKYLLYKPKEYANNQRAYPLVISLHGSSLKGDDVNKLKRYGLPQLVDQGREYEFIIASPQCPDGKFWSTDNWFEPLYEELTARYRIDPKRVYLTGISMGGYGAWQTAVAYPDKFAAILPLCGGCDDSTQVCRISHVPVWTFHATDDYVIPIDETERLVRRLNLCNGNVKFTKLNNVGHAIQYLYEDNSLYDWLLKQHK
ncbi:alpha/beta fold hydrolase [Larkinella harenae]